MKVGERIPTHGFSSCKFIPGTNDELIVATKSEEIEGTVASYVMVFNIHGEVIMQEEKIGDRKFEGIEFLWSLFFCDILVAFYIHSQELCFVENILLFRTNF